MIIMILASLLNIGNSNLDEYSFFIGKGENQNHFTCRPRESKIQPLLPYYFGKMASRFHMKNTNAFLKFENNIGHLFSPWFSVSFA